MKHTAAVIGVGFVGRAHVDALRRLGIPIRGILAAAYASLDELAGDATVTAVHICTPNYVDFEQASKLLRSGKHVLCEKPLAMDSRESEMLVKLARESKRVGGVAYNLRYYPLCQEARALIAEGAIGQPRIAQASFLQDGLLHPTDWNWQQKLGGDLRVGAELALSAPAVLRSPALHASRCVHAHLHCLPAAPLPPSPERSH
jgi:predicted dehydrogenase